MSKTITFPGGKSTPAPGNTPAAKPPQTPEDGALMAALCEQRDRAMTRRLNVQNRITRGELIPRDTVKLTLGRISGSWSSVIPEASRTISPIILAILGSKDPTADSRLRLLIDDEAYSAGGHANEAMEKWLSSRKTDEAE